MKQTINNSKKETVASPVGGTNNAQRNAEKQNRGMINSAYYD